MCLVFFFVGGLAVACQLDWNSFPGTAAGSTMAEKNGRSTTTISRRLRNIDIVRHITQASCDAYFNEIMSHVTQTDPVAAPGDEHVAPVLSDFSHEHVQQQIVVADFLEPPVPVVESFTPAPAVTYTAPAPVIKHVSFALDDPARIDCVAPAWCVLTSLVHFLLWMSLLRLYTKNRSPLNKLFILKS